MSDQSPEHFSEAPALTDQEIEANLYLLPRIMHTDPDAPDYRTWETMVTQCVIGTSATAALIANLLERVVALEARLAGSPELTPQGNRPHVGTARYAETIKKEESTSV